MFSDYLNQIKREVKGFTNSPSIIMPHLIQRKLDRSLDNYLKEIEININYLLYRDNRKVIKYLEKAIPKEEEDKDD